MTLIDVTSTLAPGEPVKMVALDRDLAELARGNDDGEGSTVTDWEYLLLTARKHVIARRLSSSRSSPCPPDSSYARLEHTNRLVAATSRRCCARRPNSSPAMSPGLPGSPNRARGSGCLGGHGAPIGRGPPTTDVR
jgi:hypothetical protein